MGTRIVNVVWAAGKDAYHLDRARQQFAESDYFDALAEAIREQRPSSSYAEAMRDALAVDAYNRHLLEGHGIGRRARDLLQARHAEVSTGIQPV